MTIRRALGLAGAVGAVLIAGCGGSGGDSAPVSTAAVVQTAPPPTSQQSTIAPVASAPTVTEPATDAGVQPAVVPVTATSVQHAAAWETFRPLWDIACAPAAQDVVDALAPGATFT